MVFAIASCVTLVPSLAPPPLPVGVYMRQIVPIGALISLDVACSNLALSQLSVSLHTIIRGTGPVFVLFAGLLLGIERASFMLFFSVTIICAGIALAAASDISYSLAGITYAFLSCAFAD